MPNGFGDTFEHVLISDLVVFATNVVISVLLNAANVILQNAGTNTGAILGAIDTNTGVITETVKSTVEAAEAVIRADILDVQTTVITSEANILTEVRANNNLLGGIVDVLRDGINVAITNNILVEDTLFGTLLANVKDIIGNSNRGIIDALSVTGATFSEVVKNILAVFAEDQLGDKPELRLIADAILVNKPEASPVIASQLDDSEDGAGGITWDSRWKRVKAVLGIGDESLPKDQKLVDLPEFETALKFICRVLDPSFDPDTRDDADEFIQWIGTVVATLLWPFTQAAASGQMCLAAWSEDNPWKLAEPPDVVRAFYLGLLDDKDTLRFLKRSGYPLDDAQMLVNTAQTIPSIDFVLSMWLRGIIPDTQINFTLKQLGYNAVNSERIKEAAFFIPPVQDLITMSVREVFSPTIRAENRQDENFPPDFAKFARQQGVSDEWARNYWAAHWILPSPQMGFEMVHRGVITERKLRSLLQALDVMPGWVDSLIAISFQPITRVDIRRLHKLDLLSRSETLKRYKDIGYSPDDAELMTKFTVELNSEDSLLTLDVASDLTRSNIIGFYKDGIINKAITVALLLQAGINVAAANLFVEAADFDIERRNRKLQIDLIFDGFKFGGNTEGEAADRLAGLGLQRVELNLANLELTKLVEQETKLPSRADLDKFLKQKVISEAAYIDQLVRAGYSELWAGRYLEIARG